MNRRDLAREHHSKMLNAFPSFIQDSIFRSIVHIDDSVSVEIQDTDCLSAVIDNYSVQTTILNFASYTSPGGGYMLGDFAQEESLCSESYLYEVLSHEEFDDYYNYNKEHKNYGLYENRAIFSPDIRFERDNKKYYSHVLTIAAPNYKEAIKNGISHDEIVKTYRKRLNFIYTILSTTTTDLFIAGAWGCGVFGFPKEIAIQLFKECATINTILAIPSDAKFNPQKYAETKLNKSEEE